MIENVWVDMQMYEVFGRVNVFLLESSRIQNAISVHLTSMDDDLFVIFCTKIQHGNLIKTIGSEM